jgi:hypothetical protein
MLEVLTFRFTSWTPSWASELPRLRLARLVSVEMLHPVQACIAQPPLSVLAQCRPLAVTSMPRHDSPLSP